MDAGLQEARAPASSGSRVAPSAGGRDACDAGSPGWTAGRFGLQPALRPRLPVVLSPDTRLGEPLRHTSTAWHQD